MSGFLLGLVLGILINLVTALFSRDKALKLIPWMMFYLLIHASYAILNTSPLILVLTTSMKHMNKWGSYALVMVVGAVLAAIYWRAALSAGRRLDRVTTSADHSTAPAPVQQQHNAVPSPTADEIADAIRKKSEPPALEKARRYRLRRDLTQYLARGSMERETFRILLQPTVDEKGSPGDPTEQLGKAMLRIQEWHSELTFYVHSRLGEDYALWLMSKTHGEGYPGNIGNVPGLSQSWDTVASGVAKVEQLLRELPELPGGAEAAVASESRWRPTDGAIEWKQDRIDDQRLRISFKAAEDLDNPILQVHFDSPFGGQPTIQYDRHPILIGNKRSASAQTYHFEILGKWPKQRAFSLTFPAASGVAVEEVQFRLW